MKKLIIFVVLVLLVLFFYPKTFDLNNKDKKCIGLLKSGVMTMDAPPTGPSIYIPNTCFGILLSN